MQAKLILTFFALLTLIGSAFYILNYNSQEKSLENYIQGVEFNPKSGHLTWNLQRKIFGDFQVNAIAQSISENELQQQVGTDKITSIELNLSQNANLKFRPILDALKESSINSYLTRIVLDINNIQSNFDFNFNGYILHDNIKELRIMAENNTETSLENIARSIQESKSLRYLQLHFPNCNLQNVDILMESIFKLNELKTLRLHLANNNSSIFTNKFTNTLLSLFKNRPKLFTSLGFQQLEINSKLLVDMEEILYPELIKEESEQQVQLFLQGNLFEKNEADLIFKNLKDSVGNRFQYYC